MQLRCATGHSSPSTHHQDYPDDTQLKLGALPRVEVRADQENCGWQGEKRAGGRKRQQEMTTALIEHGSPLLLPVSQRMPRRRRQCSQDDSCVHGEICRRGGHDSRRPRPAETTDVMPVAFQGVVIGAPEGVGVSFEGDSLRLSFEGFTGSVCIAPQHGSHGAPDGVAAALPVDKTPHDRPLPSSVTLFKRSRVSSPAAVTSSCSAGESLFDGAPTKASGVVAESGLLVPPDVFPNGGLSQDWYPGADEAMRLCDSEDDAVRTSDSEECFPSQRPVALQWDDAVSHSTSPLCSERLSGVEIEAHSSLAPLEQSAAGMDETVPHVPCGHVSASAGPASQNLELAEAIHAPARPDATLASLHTTGVLDAAAAGEVFPFSRDTPLFRWEWHRVAATGPPPPPRWAHCAAELNGEMLVFGGDTLADPDDGTSDRLADLYAFDAAGLRWRRCQDAPQGRAWHSGTSVRGSLDGASDIFLVFGGEAVKPPAKMIAAAVPKEPADAAAGSTAVPSTDRPKRTGRLQSLSSMLSFDPE